MVEQSCGQSQHKSYLLQEPTHGRGGKIKLRASRARCANCVYVGKMEV